MRMGDAGYRGIANWGIRVEDGQSNQETDIGEDGLDSIGG